MTEQLQEYAVELVEAVKGIAPDALQVAIQITRINAIGDLFAAAGLSVGLVFVVRAIRWALGKMEEDDLAVGPTFVVVGGSIGGLFAGICAAAILLNIWTWVALFSPELRLAHDALVKLVGP